MSHSGWPLGFLLLGLLFIGVVCFGLAFLVGLALSWILRDVLPPNVLVALGTTAVLVLGVLFWFASVKVLFLALARREASREATRRRQLESRAPLTDEEFSHLFPKPLHSVAARVRNELSRFIDQPEAGRRLSPTDCVLDICQLAGVKRDSLDWVEFVAALEGYFGTRIPDDVAFEGTIADLVAACGRTAKSRAEPGEVSDGTHG